MMEEELLDEVAEVEKQFDVPPFFYLSGRELAIVALILSLGSPWFLSPFVEPYLPGIFMALGSVGLALIVIKEGRIISVAAIVIGLLTAWSNYQIYDTFKDFDNGSVEPYRSDVQNIDDLDLSELVPAE